MSLLAFEGMFGIRGFARLGGASILKDTFFLKGAAWLTFGAEYSPLNVAASIFTKKGNQPLTKQAYSFLTKRFTTKGGQQVIDVLNVATYNKQSFLKRLFNRSARLQHKLAGVVTEEARREVLADLSFTEARNLAKSLGGTTFQSVEGVFSKAGTSVGNVRASGKLALGTAGRTLGIVGGLSGAALTVTVPWLAVDIGKAVFDAASNASWSPYKDQLGNKNVSVSYGQHTQRQVMLQHLMNSQMAVGNILGNEASYFRG